MASAASGNGCAAADRNKAIVFALCKRLALDPKKIFRESIEEYDIATLFTNILQLLATEAPLPNQDEILKWVAFANSFPGKVDTSLKALNDDLAHKAVLLGGGLKPSVADIVVFAGLHSFVSHLNETEVQKFPNVMRWMDYIQILALTQQKKSAELQVFRIVKKMENIEDFGGMLGKICIKKPQLEPYCPKKLDKVDAIPSSKKEAPKSGEKSEGNAEAKKVSDEKKAPTGDKAKAAPVKDNKATEDKKKAAEKESAEKDAECSVSILNIQVGLIRKAWKHPSADSLLVEEIDVGEGNVRQVVSGLAKFFSPEELANRRVVLITNVKPGKLRDVMSAGLVLCASNQDHTVVEPLIPPEGATIGERVSFAGHEGKPEDVLNPKKKQLEKITPHLYTDDKGVATYKGVPFMTSSGPCMSSISNGGIK